MSSASASAIDESQTTRDRREFVILIVAGVLAGGFGWLLQSKFRFFGVPELRIFGVLEMIAIVSAAVLASFNYFRTFDSLRPGTLPEGEIKACKDKLYKHARIVMLLFGGCYLSIFFHLRPFVLSLLLAMVYFTFILSNRHVLQLISTKCATQSPATDAGQEAAYKYMIIAANHVYFYREENYPSLIAYVILAVFCSALPLSALLFSNPDPDLRGIRSLAAGAALFHLGLSTIRFRRIFSSSDDAIEKLVRLGVHDPDDRKYHDLRLRGACALSKKETDPGLEKWPVWSFLACLLLGVAAYIFTPDSSILGSDTNADASVINGTRAAN